MISLACEPDLRAVGVLQEMVELCRKDHFARNGGTQSKSLLSLSPSLSFAHQTHSRLLPQMLWLKNHMPSSLFQNCMFFDLPDWLSYRATEDLARSNCSLACKCSYVPPGVEGSKGWNDEFFTEIGLEEFVRCLEGPLRSPLIFPRLMSRSFPNNVGQERFRSSRRDSRKERIDLDCWTTCRKGSFC